MKSRIIIVICFLLPAMPVLSFAQEKKRSDSNISAYEHANENARFKLNGVFNEKVAKENKAKWLTKKTEKEAAETEIIKQGYLIECEQRYKVNELDPNISEKSRKKTLKAMEKCERQYRQDVPGPGVSIHKRADENTEFQRDRAEYNNKKNQLNRAKKRTETKKTNESERKKKADKDRDKGEGQFKLDF